MALSDGDFGSGVAGTVFTVMEALWSPCKTKKKGDKSTIADVDSHNGADTDSDVYANANTAADSHNDADTHGVNGTETKPGVCSHKDADSYADTVIDVDAVADVTLNCYRQLQAARTPRQCLGRRGHTAFGIKATPP